MIWRARSSSASFTSTPSTASSISAFERMSSARKSVSSASASPYGRIRQIFSEPRRTKRPSAAMFVSRIAASSSDVRAAAPPAGSTGAR